MPSVTAQADVARDWRGLLDSTEKSPDLLPSVETERQGLILALDQFQILKAQQEHLTALRQATTQQLREVMARGKDLAIQIRSVLRGKVGPRSELLVHYKIAPIRRRPRKLVEAVVKKSADEGTKPVVEASPADPVA